MIKPHLAVRRPVIPRRLPKSRKARVVVIALAILALYAWGVWHLGSWLESEGLGLWILRGGLWLLGLVAAGLVVWYLFKSIGPEDRGDAIDAAIEAAQARLASSPIAQKRRASSKRERRFGDTPTLGNLPLVLLLGPEGSAKTTAVVHSGLNAQLLAGEVFQGDLVAPTESVNLWYAGGTVLVEAGGRVSSDTAGWASLVQQVQPHKLAPLITGEAPAPRAAVVVYSCEELLSPVSSSSVPATARALREQLLEASQRLGVRLPVYVLFSKADRIPFFEDFVRNLSHEESREVLGTTFRLPPDTPPVSYSDWQYRHLGDAFQAIYRSLSFRRLEMLPRDGDPQSKAHVYEFPRQFLKLKTAATQFLVELCKPSQLDVSPFLRGFYLTGVRPIVVTESNVPPHAQATPEAEAASPTPRSRKVPQWLFLERLFREVILRDRVAMAVSQGGVKVRMRRRWLLGTAAAVALIFSSCFSISYIGNRNSEARTLRHARALAALDGDRQGAYSPEAFRILDELRSEVARLERYERRRPPWRLRWGLYAGSSVYPVARDLYLGRFEEALMGPTRASLLDSLQSARDAGDNRASFELLKAYLMTTTQTARIDSVFLAPLLSDRWLSGRSMEAESEELVRRQFRFYSGPVCRGDGEPCATRANETAVRMTCDLLEQASGPERLYPSLLSAVSRTASGVSFNDPERVVVNGDRVPGAFTETGYETAQQNLEGVELDLEAWVCPEQAVSESDLAALRTDLQRRYVSDYIQRWRSFLAATSIGGFSNAAEARRSLEHLVDNQSPLLQLLAIISQNTAVDSQVIAPAFQPVHAVMPPGVTDPLIGESNQPYVEAIRGLLASVEQLERAGPEQREASIGATAAAVAEAKNAVRQLADNFRTGGQAGAVGESLKALLFSPIDQIERMVERAPASDLYTSLSSFCTGIQPLLSKFPFRRDAEQPATLEEVELMFHPESGEVRRFYDELLRDFVDLRGTRYVSRDVRPRPTDAFVQFFDEAASVTRALWPQGATEPRIELFLRPSPSAAIPIVEINIDGRTARSDNTTTQTTPVVWAGSDAGYARLDAYIDGAMQNVFDFRGTWALFRLFQRATWRSLGAAGDVAAWQDPSSGGRVEVVLVDGAPEILMRSGLMSASCAPGIVR